jgi:acyl-CoA thioester hydrolase
MTNSPFTHRLRVRYHECDPQGIVFNANYFIYFELAYVELWRVTFGRYPRILEEGIDSVVAEARARFIGTATVDDEINVQLTVDRLGTTSLTLTTSVVVDGRQIVEGQLRTVMIDDRGQKTPMPSWVRDGLLQHVVHPG